MPRHPDFLAALIRSLEEPWRHFNVFGIWQLASELAEEPPRPSVTLRV